MNWFKKKVKVPVMCILCGKEVVKSGFYLDTCGKCIDEMETRRREKKDKERREKMERQKKLDSLLELVPELIELLKKRKRK